MEFCRKISAVFELGTASSVPGLLLPLGRSRKRVAFSTRATTVVDLVLLMIMIPQHHCL